MGLEEMGGNSRGVEAVHQIVIDRRAHWWVKVARCLMKSKTAGPVLQVTIILSSCNVHSAPLDP
jgi:hypothetical protein